MSSYGYSTVAFPPTPPARGEAFRWNHTRLRRRMLDGQWRKDLEDRVQAHVGSVRSDAWGRVDLSSNPYRVISRELATLYNAPPQVRHNLGADSVSTLVDAIDASGLWAAMARYQAWVIGCREYLIRAHATKDGLLRYRPVPPDLVCARESLELPDTADRIEELRLREDPRPGKDGHSVWAWDVFDIRNPDRPIHQVIEAGNDGGPTGADLSPWFLGVDGMAGPEGGLIGDAYPHVRSDGRPVLPYVVHHAERLGDRLWDTYEGLELVEGSLNLGVLHSFWFHLVKDASWPQRYAVNARPVGLTTTGPDGQEQRLEIVTDPASLLVLEAISNEPGAAVIVSQWEAGGDPEKLLGAIESYGARLAQDAGVSGSDLKRSSGDPRSGYAISLSNEGKRQAQRRFAPHFRWSDQQLVSLSAILLNRATGSKLPEDGYAVAYQQIPLSPEELRSLRDHVLALMGAGLMSPIDGYLELNPGLTREQAREDLERIAAEKRDLGALVSPPATGPAIQKTGGAQAPAVPLDPPT